MAKAINNVKRAVSNTVNAATSTVAVSSELLADSTGLITNTVQATPAVLKALLEAPFAAAKGYLMDAEGLSAEQAEAKAYHYLRQDVAKTVTEVSEAGGRLFSDLMKDDDDDNTKDVESDK